MKSKRRGLFSPVTMANMLTLPNKEGRGIFYPGPRRKGISRHLSNSPDIAADSVSLLRTCARFRLATPPRPCGRNQYVLTPPALGHAAAIRARLVAPKFKTSSSRDLWPNCKPHSISFISTIPSTVPSLRGFRVIMPSYPHPWLFSGSANQPNTRRLGICFCLYLQVSLTVPPD